MPEILPEQRDNALDNLRCLGEIGRVAAIALPRLGTKSENYGLKTA
jgi:hypothetical protein